MSPMMRLSTVNRKRKNGFDDKEARSWQDLVALSNSLENLNIEKH